MNKPTNTGGANALVNSHDSGYPVSIGELRQAIAMEIRSLEFRSATIHHQMRGSKARTSNQYKGSTNRSKSGSANESAREGAPVEKYDFPVISNADPALQARLQRNYLLAKQKLNELTNKITRHEKSLQQHHAVVRIFMHAFVNRDYGLELIHQKVRAERQLNRAIAAIETVSVTFKQQRGQSREREFKNNNKGNQVSQLEERKLSIILSFLTSELAARRELQNLLVGVANDAVVHVPSPDLDATIRHPSLHRDIVSLKKQGKLRLLRAH
ncbi:hypothetical protein [uncultured Zhongshania sp.]|uniref:hypothetical protein n=1 Tax=uncultured Zhongshania sp. TaxID=1642288 RepID=UPI0025D9C1AF|nr:hypothetical protein [uncultured Zhongshania sp.]